MAKLKDGTTVFGDATVQKTLTVGNIAITGNLIVQGTTTSVDSTVTRVEDPIFELGGGAAGAALSASDGKDRGILMHYYASSAPVDAFMGWNTHNSQFEFGSAATEADGVITVGTYGNVRANVFIGNGSGLSNIQGPNVHGTVASANNASYAGIVTASSQSNITSVGTLTSLTVSGISNVSTLNSNGVITVTDTTTSTSTTSGALLVAGGTGIAGDLWVGGTIHGAISGSTSAPGLDTNVVFNDGGISNATGGFTFDKTGNIVTVNKVSIDGNNSNIDITGTGKLTGTTGVNVVATSGAVNLTASGKDFTVNSIGISYNANFSVGTNGDLTANGYANIASNISAAGGNFTVNTDGNVDATRGNFTSIKDTGLTDTQLVFTSDNVLGGSAGLTYASNTLSANNFATANANITGNITTKFTTGGKLLTTEATTGNLVESTISFSADTLTVRNANVTANLETANLQVTSFGTNGIPIADSNGNLSTSAGLTFTSDTLYANNFTSSGNVVAAKVTANNLTATQLVFAGADKELTSNAQLTYTTGSNTLSANNFTASGNITGAKVSANNVADTEIAFANIDHTLVGASSFTYNSGTSTLSANNVVASSSILGDKVSANNLSNTQIAFANIDHTLVGASSFTYNSDTSTLSANNVSVTTDITSGNVYANSGTVKATTLTGTLSTAEQTNVTSLGTLTGLTINGNLLISNTTATSGIKTDNLYYSNGTPWDLQQAAGSDTQIQFNTGDNFDASANLTFNAGTSTLTVTGTANATTVNATTGNITTVNSSNVNATGDIKSTGGNITANLDITADGNVSGNNVTATHLVTTVDLKATGNANVVGYLKAGDTTIAGNLTVTGTTTSVNTTVSQLSDPLFDLGNGANGASLTTDDGKDRGLIMHTFNGTTSSTVDVFMGYKDSAGEFVLAKNVTVTDNIVNYGATDSAKQANLADLRIGNINAYNANFGGVVFSEGNVTLGTGSYLVGDVKGNISGNIKVAGVDGSLQFANSVTEHLSTAVVATAIQAGKYYKIISSGTTDFTAIGAASNSVGTYFTASGAGTGTGTASISSTYGDLDNAGANLTYLSGNLNIGVGSGGNVRTDHLFGTIETAAQGNVTSVGTLEYLNVNDSVGNGIVSATYVQTDNLQHADGTAWDFATAAGPDGAIQISTSGDLANVSGFTYSSGNLNVPGNIVTGSGTGGNITGANVISATTVSATGDVSGATLTGNITTANQSNITTVGTLGSLSVTNFANVGNIRTNAVSDTQVVYGSSNTLVGSSGFTFNSGSNTLTVNNVTMSDTANAANVIVTSLTSTRITFAGTGGKLVDSTNLTFSGTELGITGTASISGTVSAGNVTSNAVGDTQVVFGDNSRLVGSSGLTYNSSTTTLTANNFVASTTANLGAVGNITITGSTSGQYLRATSGGGLEFASVDTSILANGTSNVHIATVDGDVTVGVAGATVLDVSTLGLTVTGIITATGNITGANIISNASIVASGTTDATSSITGAITTAGGISAQGNIYTGHSVGFANNNGGTASAAYIHYNATAGSLDFIFD